MKDAVNADNLFLFINNVFFLTTDVTAASQLKTDNMVLIPASVFMMGAGQLVSVDDQSKKEYSADETPIHEIKLKAYFIDKTEVTVGKYKQFLAAADLSPPRDPRFPAIYPWSKDNPPPDMLSDHPVVYVSWYDADRYCRWNEKRLPTESEWEFAARGNAGIIYPWGNYFDVNYANVKEKYENGTLSVKSLKRDMSPFGVYDMGGNIAEWTSSWYEAYPDSTLKKKNYNKKFKVIKGGSWVLPGRFYARASGRSMSGKPIKRHRGIGFRCALDSR